MNTGSKERSSRGFIHKTVSAIDALLAKQFKLETERSAILLEKDMLLGAGAGNSDFRIMGINTLLKGIEEKMSVTSLKLAKQRARLSKQVVLIFAGVMLLLFVFVYALIKVYQPNFGHDVGVGYYEALANILAALLIALFLTPSEEGAPDGQHALSTWTLVLYGG